jgi:hypothetical protein
LNLSFRKESIEKSDKARKYCDERGLNYKDLKIGYNGGKLFGKLRHCIILPLKDKEGNICSLYGRRAFDYHGKEKPHWRAFAKRAFKTMKNT